MGERSGGTKFTKEQIEKAMQCKDADELLALAKAEGFDITKDEAEAYMAELSDSDLDAETLRAAVGGTGPYSGNVDYPYKKDDVNYPYNKSFAT